MSALAAVALLGLSLGSHAGANSFFDEIVRPKLITIESNEPLAFRLRSEAHSALREIFIPGAVEVSAKQEKVRHEDFLAVSHIGHLRGEIKTTTRAEILCFAGEQCAISFRPLHFSAYTKQVVTSVFTSSIPICFKVVGVCGCAHVEGHGLAYIFCGQVYAQTSGVFSAPFPANHIEIQADPRTQFALANFFRDADGFVCGFGRKVGLTDHVVSVVSRAPGMVQRSPNQNDTSAGKKDRAESRNEHPHGPKRHTLLGVQIVFLTLYFVGVFALVLRGYKIANSGFDSLDSGNKRRGVLLFWSGYFLACGSALGLPFLGYWLTFESRFFGLL